MIVYLLVCVFSGLSLAGIGVYLSRSCNMNIVNCSHKQNVKNKERFCSQLGKLLVVMGVLTGACGVFGYVGGSENTVGISSILLCVGIAVISFFLFRVTKKHTGYWY